MSSSTVLLEHQAKMRQRNPFDEYFDQKVQWAREHFDIPGLAVAVVREDDVFSKVSRHL